RHLPPRATFFPYPTLFRSLRGLSSPSSARQGNLYGMVGMAIAIVTTLLVAAPNDWVSWLLIIGGIGIGGGIGAYIARSVKMTDIDRKSTRLNSSHVKSSYA